MKFTLILITSLTLTSMVNAALTVARFDLGQSAEAGWDLITTGDLVGNQNGITLSVSGSGLSSRTRGTIPTNVAQDFLFNNNTISFNFTGLIADQGYQFLTYSHDNTGGGAEAADWYVGSVTPGNLQYSWVNSSSTIAPFTLLGTANGAGELTINLVATNSNNRANGFEVVQVPEPSSTALLGLGGLALILRRRK